MNELMKPLGFTADGERIGFEVQTTTGKAILELPLEELPKYAHIFVQAAEAGAKHNGDEYHAPAFQTAMWGVGSDDDTFVIRLHVMKGGEYKFAMPRDTALDFAEGLQETAGFPARNTQKPN